MILHDPAAVMRYRVHQGVHSLLLIPGKAATDPVFPFTVNSLQNRGCHFTLPGEEESDSPSVFRVSDPPDISGTFEFFYCPRYGSLIEMVVPDKGLLHDVLLTEKQHQDRELSGGESQRPEPVIEEDKTPASRDGNKSSEGDIRHHQ